MTDEEAFALMYRCLPQQQLNRVQELVFPGKDSIIRNQSSK